MNDLTYSDGIPGTVLIIQPFLHEHFCWIARLVSCNPMQLMLHLLISNLLHSVYSYPSILNRSIIVTCSILMLQLLVSRAWKKKESGSLSESKSKILHVPSDCNPSRSSCLIATHCKYRRKASIYIVSSVTSGCPRTQCSRCTNSEIVMHKMPTCAQRDFTNNNVTVISSCVAVLKKKSKTYCRCWKSKVKFKNAGIPQQVRRHLR